MSGIWRFCTWGGQATPEWIPLSGEGRRLGVVYFFRCEREYSDTGLVYMYTTTYKR